MPELPDIEVFSYNLNRQFAGKKLTEVKIVSGKKLRDAPGELAARLQGKVLNRIYRSGKEMRLEFADGTLLGLHLMLTGDLFQFEKTNSHHSTIAELHFADGTGLALTDRMKNANIKLDPVDKKGADALSGELNFRYLKKAFQRKKTVKDLLMDQDVIRGIGNGYSDEILWQAGISPYSVAEKIPDEKIKQLAALIKKVLREAAGKILKAYPGKINVEVKEFLQIHSKEHTQSPTGGIIQVHVNGLRKTYFTDEQVLYK